MDNVEIRNVQKGDEKTLAYIQTESWKAAFDKILPPQILEKCTDIVKAEEMYQNILAGDFSNGRLLTVNGSPHCIAFWSKNRDESAGGAELVCIHSLRDGWHQGFGSKMMEYVLEEMKTAGYDKVVLWVFEQNVRACKFYEKHGFVLTGYSKKFHDAVEVMYEKKL